MDQDKKITELSKILLFSNDKTLHKRYSDAYITERIEVCFKEGYYIEAYTIAIQYCEHLISKVFDVNSLEVKTVIKTLHKLRMVSQEYLQNYSEVNSRRGRLAHRVIGEQEIRKQISREVENADKILNLVSQTEELFLSIYRDFVVNKNDDMDTIQDGVNFPIFARLIYKRVVKQNPKIIKLEEDELHKEITRLIPGVIGTIKKGDSSYV